VGLLASLFRRFKTAEPDDFLRSCSEVIQVGANSGERELYAQHGLNVVWIEPIPEVYTALTDNIVGSPSQTAINALITDKDGEKYTLHVANNQGASSSILDLHDDRDIWPEVHYVRDIAVSSATLPAALHKAGVGSLAYDRW
jgi:FkbM family methyltransferase